MKSFSIQPTEAYKELFEALESGRPVHVTFKMSNMYGTLMVINVDGEPSNVVLNLTREGRWEATYYPEIPEHLGE